MKKSKISRVPPPGESRAPARAPAWSHSGSGRGGIPTARNPPRGETQGPGFFSFFGFFCVFFRFLAFSKKIKNSKKNYGFVWIFLLFRKNQKTKNEKNPGCSCGEGLGLQQGSRLDALRKGQKASPRAETQGPGFFDFFKFFSVGQASLFVQQALFFTCETR